jgi:hypothetical protein
MKQLNLTISSAFRNSPQRQIDRWVSQVRALLDACPDYVVTAAPVEGDSTYDTYTRLVDAMDAADISGTVHVCNHGGPMYGSVENPDRMRNLSKVLNCCLDACKPDAHVFMFVESDLIWSPNAVRGLVSTLLLDPSFDVLAPLVFAGQYFYDVWGFRKDGTRFSPLSPYHSGMSLSADITEVDSVGSCFVARADKIQEARAESGALVEWCDRMRALGSRIGVTPLFQVEHPR